MNCIRLMKHVLSNDAFTQTKLSKQTMLKTMLHNVNHYRQKLCRVGQSTLGPHSVSENICICYTCTKGLLGSGRITHFNNALGKKPWI